MKPFKENLKNHISACFSGIWLETFEPEEAIRELKELCKEESWQNSVWDVGQGLSELNGECRDPLSVLEEAAKLSGSETPNLVILRNFHRFLGSIEMIQAMERQIHLGKSNRTYWIVLAPVVNIPVELAKQFVVIDHPLPSKEQLRQIANEIAGELPDEPSSEKIIEAASGMTRMEAEGAFALSIIEHDRLLSEPLWTMKANMLKQSSSLRLYRGEIPNLGGLDALSTFCDKVLKNTTGERGLGVMLLGVSGSGKSAFCKQLGYSVKRPTLILDIGALMGSLVGQTEEALRKALKQIDAMSPCIVMIDEVEKAISTAGNDSGVSVRLFGTLLTWLNDRTSDSFVVCTANDISKLPPEFTRAERFDGIFFVDLPDEDTKQKIWSIYKNEFGITDQVSPDDTDWTGAEIKACCRLSKLLGISLQDAASNVVPVANTAAESIHKLRTWASNRCLNASQPGVYKFQENQTAARRNFGKAINPN